ncbi:MAG TPA: site-specific tyrosine recombinase [bacterium]|uniref:Tyrosine recombinase XerC n=1 Tax=candidate division TA06 bacterium ADurb.Bin417 TaxID=1852828 RepID=A0A1V5MHZ9_UNCT6|nr:MAG: Tyrosine recombinase XerD [candidate division TA06 bacterium ADurb.Bin417]HNQ35398.1 site-specific tyrosine recombinase [bacterium]HNS49213.1 site-specific tyrosine recombinase [bacterium]
MAETGLPDQESFFGYLTLERGLSRNTILAYRRDLKRFDVFLSGRGLTLESITYPQFTSFLMECRRTLAAASLARLMAAISTYLKFLLQEGVLKAHPLPDLESPRLEKNLPGVLSPAEVERLLAAPKPGRPGLKDRAILELLYATGMRVSELTGLKREDLDLAEQLVRVRGKGGRERLIPFGAPAAAALRSYLETVSGSASAEVPLFRNRQGRALSRVAVWKLLRRSALSAGITAKVYPHILRHSFATHLLTAGASIRLVQELLGHQSLATTQIYTHLDRSRLKEVHRRFHPRP